MKFSQLKLRTKLGTAFLVLVVFSAAIGGFAYVQLSRLNTIAEDLATNWLPSIKVLASMRNGANLVRRAEAEHVIAEDPADLKAAEKSLAAGREKVAELRKAYEPLISSDEEKNKYTEFGSHYETYLAKQKELLLLSSGGEKTAHETQLFYRGESSKAFEAATNDIGTLIDINNKGADESHRAAEATFAMANAWTIGLVLSEVVLACLLAIWMVRSIMRQLGGEPTDAANVAQAVAAGDLAFHIDLRDHDASSMMAQLKAMQVSLSRVVSDAGRRDRVMWVVTGSC